MGAAGRVRRNPNVRCSRHPGPLRENEGVNWAQTAVAAISFETARKLMGGNTQGC